jgi:hypothetical protein
MREAEAGVAPGLLVPIFVEHHFPSTSRATWLIAAFRFGPLAVLAIKHYIGF